MSSMQIRRAELYAHIADKAVQTARDLGVDMAVAEHVAAAIVDGIAEDFGGEVLSFPKNAAYKLSRRELIILEEHRKGASIAELARRHNMGERGLRKLLKRAETRNPTLNQRELFKL